MDPNALRLVNTVRPGILQQSALHPCERIAAGPRAPIPQQPSRSVPVRWVYPQATAEGVTALASSHGIPLPPGYRLYRNSSW